MEIDQHVDRLYRVEQTYKALSSAYEDFVEAATTLARAPRVQDLLPSLQISADPDADKTLNVRFAGLRMKLVARVSGLRSAAPRLIVRCIGINNAGDGDVEVFKFEIDERGYTGIARDDARRGDINVHDMNSSIELVFLLIGHLVNSTATPA